MAGHAVMRGCLKASTSHGPRHDMFCRPSVTLRSDAPILWHMHSSQRIINGMNLTRQRKLRSRLLPKFGCQQALASLCVAITTCTTSGALYIPLTSTNNIPQTVLARLVLTSLALQAVTNNVFYYDKPTICHCHRAQA